MKDIKAISPAPADASLATEFAPAERATAQELGRQARTFYSNRLLGCLLDAIPDWVMILNQQRQIVYANDALLTLAEKLERPGVVGMRFGELLACDAAARAVSGCGTGEACRTCGAACTMLQALQGSKGTEECRIQSMRKGMVEACDLRVWGTPLKWEGEQFVLFVASDISSLKRRQVLEKIFFHDVLNTAGNIQGIACLLSMDEALVPEMVHDLSLASDSLVNEIKAQRLLLAAENNELEVNPKQMGSMDLLDNSVRAYRNHPMANERQILVDPLSADLAVRTDPTLFARVLGNMLKNALEACDAGESVVIGCKSTPNGAAFWCQNPKVMSRSVQLQIFKRSFSTKGTGRGVGTYSIKLLTERYLGGGVSFTSAEGQGTVFALHIPLNLAEPFAPCG